MCTLKRGRKGFRSAAPLYGTWSTVLMVYLFPYFILPLLLYRWLLTLAARWLRPDLSHMLRGQSSIFLRDSVHSEPNLNIVLAFHVEGAPGPPDARQQQLLRWRILFQERFVYAKATEGSSLRRGGVLAHPELQQYCVRWGGYHFWKQEPDFQIEEHVLLRQLHPQEDPGAAQLSYLREPLPAAKSPWQVLVLFLEEGADPPSHLILFKYHHSLADGYSMLHAMANWADPNTPALLLQGSAATSWGNISAIQAITLPFRLTSTFIHLLAARAPLSPWPLLPPETFAGGERYQFVYQGGGQVVRLAEVKELASRHSVSVSAVMYAALTGSLRAHFVSKYGSDSVPEHLSYAQPVPLDEHPEGLTNQLCTVTYRLPVGEEDPRARLRATDQMLAERKRSLEGHISLLMLNVLGLLPSWSPFQFRPTSSGAVCLGATNLAGPLKSISLGGSRVVRLNTQIVAAPYPFYMVMYSYNGRFEWSVNGDSRLFNEQELVRLGEGVREEIEGFGVIQPWEVPPEPSSSSDLSRC